MSPGIKSMSKLQRKSLQLIGSSLAICAGLGLAFQEIQPHHFLTVTYVAIALIGASPIVITMFVLARYLTQESDEYVRSLVVQAILWGFGLIMVFDTVLGYLVAFASMPPIHLRSLGAFNLEIFVIASGIALRIQLWRNR